MGNAFKTVRPNEPLEIEAAWKNTGNDVFQDYLRNRQRGGEPPVAPPLPQPAVIQVKNNSGVDVTERFPILGIDDPLFTPTASLDEFKRVVAHVAVTPIYLTHRGRFVVLNGPLANGKIGAGIIMGACRAKVNVVDAAHQFADVKDADATQLESDYGGSARILWKESGTGTKWAVLLLGSGDVGSGQFQGMYLGTTTQGVRGWDFFRASALPGE